MSYSKLRGGEFMRKCFLFLSILFFIPLLSFSQEDKKLKAVFDCAIGDLNWISLRLSLIKKTAENLIREGKDYSFVITIHSQCIPIVKKDLSSLPKEKKKKIEFIQSQLKTLKDFYNVDIKACRIAMSRFKIENVPRFIDTVPNSWITLIELQNSGYAFVPF